LNILLHICCGPCSLYPLQYLRQGGFAVQGYFDNPNIHPFREWLKRKETLEKYAVDSGLEIICNDDYQMEEFFRRVAYHEAERCRHCYLMRLEQTAQMAANGGFQCFSTTLLVSPYQDHQLIKDTGELVGERCGVPFYYHDFRPGYREGVRLSRELGMYRQPYCGCVYSEKERFA
jgi:predicted adenine nucleotide alpha hydrolase (AANH) superfamily ATPase